jgi:zinc/manganese transport system substrate-binding protein
MKRLFLLFPVAAALILPSEGLYAAGKKLNVVASTTTFAEIVKAVGGDRVEAHYVASPMFNIHFVQPRPSDVVKVHKADLFVFGGLDLELWADPLLEAAGKPELFRGGARNVDLSRGIRLLDVPHAGELTRAAGDIHLFGNPHFHMSPENAKTMAETLRAKLAEIDPEGASAYAANARAFAEKLDAKIREWKALCAPCAGKEIVAYHKDTDYLADFLGLKIAFYVEPKPGIPPTPRHIEFLEQYMKEAGVKVVTTSTYYPVETAKAVAERAGGKAVIIAQSVGEVPGTGDFFALFDHDVKALAEALE